MLSIVIPTKNEEGYIERILKSLHCQTFRDFEIIVADADSKDKTREIALSHGAKIVSGGGHPGIGRNNGAKAARGEDILFLDADVFLSKNFLEKNYGEFLRKRFHVATALSNALSDKAFDKIVQQQSRIWTLLLQRVFPVAAGWNIFVKKEWFQKVNGFNERLYLGEDHDFVRRICKNGGKFGVLKGPWIKVSVRRLNKEGRLGFVGKNLYSFLYQSFKGPIYYDIINYKLGEFSKKKL